MNRLVRFYFSLLTLQVLLLLFAGCEELPQGLISDDDGDADTLSALKLSQPKFSPDYKTMVVDAWVGEGVGTLALTDPKLVRIEVTEKGGLLSEASYPMPPKLLKVENLASEQIVGRRAKMLALVDLTLPQVMVNKELVAVREMRNLFSGNNLYVAFLKGTEVSETMPVTNYVLENYFQHQDADIKYLYRAVIAKMDEMANGAPWTADAKFVAMMVMSDGVTYLDDMPMDPDHFELEQQLAERKDSRPLYYADFSEPLSDEELLDNPDEDNVVTVLQLQCESSKGLYQRKFSWPVVEDNILHAFGMDIADFRFTLENPDHKVYRGRHGHALEIACYDVATDSLLVKGSSSYTLGSVYSPVIVRPRSIGSVLLQGCVATFFLILLVYLVLQLIVPYIKYRLFLKHHVMTYTGTQLSVGGNMVSESCYYCKAPFEVGDRVVAKCKHSMHIDCWEENKCQCPEYGRHCQEGRHYYNRHQPWDPQNTTFYLRWVIVAILAALAAWVVYTAQMHSLSADIFERLILFINDLQPDTPEAEKLIEDYGSHINHYPSFGLCIGFFLTLMLSFLSVAKDLWSSRFLQVFFRALLGGLGGLLFFALGGLITAALELDENTFLIDWIPWSLTGYWIALCVTWGTRIKIRHSLIIGAFLVGLVSTYLWTLLYGGSTFDYRVALLINFILFAVAMAIAIAMDAPHSECYFLSVGGIMKQMDIALYKWFRANPDEVVTIGRSVDCRLQLSWDIMSEVAPVQAEIRKSHGMLRLYALEDGITVGGKLLEQGESIRLYHGRKFMIGQTTFTYIEKDK